MAALALPVSLTFGQDLTPAPGLATYTGKTNYSALTATTSGNTPAMSGLPESLNAFPMHRPAIQGSGPVIQYNPATPLAQDPALSVRGFTGLRHVDSRTARGGNQFSITPPDQALAEGNGFVVEGVNCAIGIYDKNGDLIVPAAAANTEPMALTTFFGLPAAINRSTGVRSANPGDVVALYDSVSQHWFVEAWAQDVFSTGAGKNTSEVYLAVSQTSDPTGAWFQYRIRYIGVIPDYTKIGLDGNSLILTSNLFSISTGGFTGVKVIVLQKSQLIVGGTANAATATLGFNTGYEFTLYPQLVPPGVPYITSNGGTSYLVSSPFVSNSESSLGVWALTNTSAINGTGVISLRLGTVNTQTFNFPSQNVLQKAGFIPLGSSVGESLETLDPGDVRVQSVAYTNNLLIVALPTEVTDVNNNQVMAAAWFALSPTLTGIVPSATVTAQGIISVDGASLLRPNLVMNSSLFGGMVFTLVGTNNYPSTAVIAFDALAPHTVHIARTGNEPADDFSGYVAFGGAGTSRWGDYAAAVVDDADNSVWIATEYTPDIYRTSLTNWATYVSRVQLNTP